MKMEPVLCSVRDAAVALGIGRTKTYELIFNGQLETVTIGSRRLVRVDSIKALIQRATGGAA